MVKRLKSSFSTFPQQKLVYKARVVFKFGNANEMDKFKDEIYNKIINKYNSKVNEGTTHHGYKFYSIYIDLGVLSDIYEGLIILYPDEDYRIYIIEYYDFVNYGKYQAYIDADL